MLKTYRGAHALPWLIPWASGRYYGSPIDGTLATSGQTALSLNATPIFVPNPAGVTVDRIGAEMVTAGTAGHQFRVGIYEDIDGWPAGLALDGGLLPMDGTVPEFKAAIISQFLRQGWYWLALIAQSATGTFRNYSSGAHNSLISVTSEGYTANNIMAITSAPVSTVSTAWLNDGLPEVFPMTWGLSTEPIHSGATSARTMIRAA